MNTPLSNRASLNLKTLGVYQVGGGVIGFALTTWIAAKLGSIPLLVLLLLLIAFGLYVYSIYCGVLCFQQNVAGLRYSLINQCLQLVSFAIGGFAFQYVSGIYLSMSFNFTEAFSLMFGLGISSWQITIKGYTQLLIINFNIVALFLVIFIANLKKRIQREMVEHQILNIGEENITQQP
jgi:hypothetical protein